MNIPKIGMRNIKTTIAVFFCLLLFEIINRENSFYACIAAVICMQNTVDNSMQKSISRIIGTAIGGFVAIIVLIFLETYIIEDAYFLFIPIGIIVLIEICVAINKKDAVSICCVVYLSILITKRQEGGYLIYTIDRIIDTSIGIFIALIVNKYIKKPKRFQKDNDEEEE
ncbi:FUSC family protein [Sedimentibacter sp. MB31-C6]|uniref:FUSC family protein n=1 Tax=Sedimentibacter sp. MB31-C6 TaxID=3109366 RepID=UPI002DDC9CA4|nr:aromatic acid exporter family protein [Sedimentibacter sp. MB36-C1]WSI04358.1 aromatic acid exporter family protein [Sedimentibacter sp. MB36-C1]